MSFTVENANPDILKWARESMNLSLEDVVHKGVKSIRKIEAGERKPTHRQLEKLAALYSQSIFTFLKEVIPENTESFSPEFRNLLGKHNYISYPLRRLIRVVEEHRKVVLEMQFTTHVPLPGSDVHLKTEPSLLAQEIRDWLGIPLKEQFSWKSNRKDPGKNGFDYWRDALEKKGILVFVSSAYNGKWKVEIDEMRGFCLPYNPYPVIVINGKDKLNGRIFTLMHELGHLLLNETELDTDFDHLNNPKEVFCNHFAAELLVPQDALNHEIDTTIDHNHLDMDDLTKIALVHAQKFGVSVEVILRRLMDAKIINRKKYQEFRKAQQEHREQIQEKLRKQDGGPSRRIPNEIVERFGKRYTKKIMDAYEKQEITLNKASQFLNLKTKYFDELELILGEA